MLCYGSNLSVVIPCAASLAHHGLLGSVKKGMTLLDVDLTTVPYEHLAFLASSVGQNGHVHIISRMSVAVALSLFGQSKE